MSIEYFNAAEALAELRALCAELNLPLEDQAGSLYARVGADDQVGGALDVRFAVVEDSRLVRFTTLAPGASLKREYLADALAFCNIWNANRSMPRASVVNVDEPARDLAFMLDYNLKIDRPLGRGWVKTRLLTPFLIGSGEFFDAVVKTFAAEFVE